MKKRANWQISIFIVCALTLAACGGQGQAQPSATASAATAAPAGATTLVIMTHDSFAASDTVINAFQQQNNVKLQFIKSGDAGTALNKAILAKNKPLADAFYGLDNTFLSRALAEGIFEPYDAPLLAKIPAEFKLDPSHQALPVDYGDVCLNYDKGYLSQKNIPAPQTLEDLLKPEYKSLLVVENPATSSPGLAFLLATIGHFGPNGYLDYWKGLVQNDLLVVNDWETAYNSQFTRGGGTRPIVVSYSSSPAFEVIYAKGEKPKVAPSAAVVSDGACFRQIEFVGVLKGAQHPDLARKWVDFMLSQSFQEDMPMQMFVFPVNPDAKLTPEFTQFLVNPKQTAQVSPADIAANREKWIQAWSQVALKR